MKPFFCVLFIALLSSCTPSPEQMAAQDSQDMNYCRSLGMTANDQIANCVLMKQQQRFEADQRRRQALFAMGQSMSARRTPSYAPHPVTTSCRPVGGSVVCQSY